MVANITRVNKRYTIHDLPGHGGTGVFTGPMQQPQLESVKAELDAAVQQREGGDIEAAGRHLIQACQIARNYGYV